MYRLGEKPYPTQIVQQKLYELISSGRRIDGRAPNQHRPVKVEVDVVQKAEGSAMVSMGGTKVIAGVKFDLGLPYPDTPDKGNLTVNAELLPLASASFEPGPPDERAIELSRFVDRCLRESQALRLDRLVLIPGQKVGVVYVDVYVLDYDGNYFTPAVLASTAAIATARVQKYEVRNGILSKVEGERAPLPVVKLPTAVTVGVLRERVIVDPNSLEEAALETSVVMGWGTDDELAAIQKNTPGLLPVEVFEEITEVSRTVGAKLRRTVREAVGDRWAEPKE
ncbi:MAG: exosome complex protein Rrp42 [Aigarchaeota archaeon]|nr:exosome complex protein Rrp42 [Aigarchaeota archaeon]MCS7117318.1 exosome complex protein Rrp42 [Candidatus Calditenuaceae archaeon]MDW8042325.1 exosome complex protein Rrp42 [Nitrososphaerota archaeon]